MISFERRATPAPWIQYASPVLAFFAMVLVGAVLLALQGFNPSEVLKNFFFLSLTGGYQKAELFVKAAPLVLIALGVSIGYRANVWNIGAEGQFILGAIFGGYLALKLGDAFPGAFLVCGLAAVLGGMAWAAIPAALRTRFNANELLVSLMLVYVAEQLLFYLVNGPLKDPYAFSWPKTADFSLATQFPILLDGTRLHFGVPLAVLVAIVASFWLSRTVTGFQMRVVGLTPRAASFSGFAQKKAVWLSLMIGGGCAGLAGYIEAANNVSHLSASIPAGFGFTAIIVAFLGRLNPIGIVIAGLLLAWTYIGGETVQTFNKVPQGLTQVLQALLLFFVLASDFFITHRVRLGRRNSKRGVGA